MPQRIDYSNKDYESLRGAMLALARERLPAWTDHSPNDPGVVLVELFAYLADVMLYYQDRIANESYLDTAIEPRNVVSLLRLIGYELEPSKPASADLTLLFKPTATGLRTVPFGAEFLTTKASYGSKISFRYLGNTLSTQGIPLEIDLADSTKVRPIVHQGKEYLAYSTVPVRQVDRVIQDEILGSSNGRAGQRFLLRHSPVMAESVQVLVDEGDGFRAWQHVANLFSSSATDSHFMISQDENEGATIEFGNDQYGRSPARGVNNLRVSYLVGGGAFGNVPPHTIVKAGKLTGDIGDLVGALHAQPATGGSDREPIEVAVRRAPQQYRSQDRAVTATDIEWHARLIGAAKARARSRGWNLIDLVVAPQGGGAPSDTMREEMRRYFETRRMLTTRIEVRAPDYRDIVIAGSLEVEPYLFRDQVRRNVEQAVRELFAFDNVEFAKPLFLSKVYEVIERIEGVQSTNIHFFAREGQLVNVRLAPGSPLTPYTLPQASAVAPFLLEQTILPVGGRLDFGWSELPRGTGIRWLSVSGGLTTEGSGS